MRAPPHNYGNPHYHITTLRLRVSVQCTQLTPAVLLTDVLVLVAAAVAALTEAAVAADADAAAEELPPDAVTERWQLLLR